MRLQEISVQYVKGVGPARKKTLERLGVHTVEDLLYLFPRRYEDRRHLTPIAQARVGEVHTVAGRVVFKRGRRSWYTRKHVLEVILDDGSGRLSCLWFNQAYLDKTFQPGQRVVCYGRVACYQGRLQMVVPEYEILGRDQDDEDVKRIVPIYPLTRGVSQRFLRRIIRAALARYRDGLCDELPVDLRNKYRLPNIKRALTMIHCPEDLREQKAALERVSFEEFYFFQVSVLLRRLSIVNKRGVAHEVRDRDLRDFARGLPFTLTGAQQRALREIVEDMRRPRPMLRLLQGDVGSGKTVVALGACVLAARKGYQACMMAPTGLLARQHFENIGRMVDAGALTGICPVFFSGDLPKRERETALDRMASGEANLVVGTHALLSEAIVFKRLSLVVIDEQHKFGVRQRALLTRKGDNPDVLIMTATPIPRTLCLTLYGDLDVSILDERPKGRKEVRTRLYANDQAREAYAFIRQKVGEGRQAYIVYPLVEESEKLDLKAAKDMLGQLEQEEFQGFRLALVHGQMKAGETENIMVRFQRGEIDILVATTVLEVGVDVPNASVIAIEHAERFGLAQLHQLRGRVGRGGNEAWCLLIASQNTPESQARLQAICSTTDGFRIAQHDLEIRGPGQFFGRHQHGLNELKVANPATQLAILRKARQEAQSLIKRDPQLSCPVHRHIRQTVRRRYPQYLSLATAG